MYRVKKNTINVVLYKISMFVNLVGETRANNNNWTLEYDYDNTIAFVITIFIEQSYLL